MNDITYHNKDITSKVFADRFVGKAFKVYSINMPEIKEVLPTNLPEFSANELRMDNIFLLADDSIAIVDYESAYKPENKHKYISYVNRVLAHYERKWNRHIDIKMIVIYTADVTRDKTDDMYDVGCLKFEVEAAYLSEINKEEISARLTAKIKANKPLSDEEMMEYILLPMAYKGDMAKNNAIADEIRLAEAIEDEETKVFLLTGLVVFTDKVINEENSNTIRRMISMTKVGQLFEKEAVEREKNAERKLILNLIKNGVSDEVIYKSSENLSMNEIKELRSSLA